VVSWAESTAVSWAVSWVVSWVWSVRWVWPGRMRVTLLADHRLLHGVPAARALAALEETLTGEIVHELVTLTDRPRSPA
jgi:hypothetical protein